MRTFLNKKSIAAKGTITIIFLITACFATAFSQQADPTGSKPIEGNSSLTTSSREQEFSNSSRSTSKPSGHKRIHLGKDFWKGFAIGFGTVVLTALAAGRLTGK